VTVPGSASLGGGYAASMPDAGPTVEALLEAARAGDASARLVVLAGPPGSGKSTVAAQLLRRLPGTLLIDKDWSAGGFILEADRQDGGDGSAAYGTPRYWQRLRPLEYAGAMRAACAQLVGRRTVILAGGWGPELADEELWPGLRQCLAPASLQVLHLDAPPLPAWCERMRARGSRADRPWFDDFAARLTSTPVWSGAQRIATDGTVENTVQRVLDALAGPSAGTRCD
jgi:energy-coupling factor transporter ATP-binding protein EcfA2